MNDVNDILGFDPSQLNVFNENEKKSKGNPLIYHTRPSESKSEDGIYRSTIQVIYNPFNLKDSALELQSYGLEDARGFFEVVSSLTNDDPSCPIFTAWKKCRYSDDEKMQALAKRKDEGGMFDKRFARYVTIQVIEDENQPDLVGKYLFWKIPAAIWKKIQAKIKPTDPKKAKIPVMDFLFGRAIELEVTPGPDDAQHPERKSREISYDTSEVTDDIVSCTAPTGESFLNDAEQSVLNTYVEAMKKVWKEKDPAKRATLDENVRADENTKKLGKIYSKVLEEIKKVCPNLIDELGYKPWTPEVTARVNAYIECVLAGNNPKVATPAVAKEIAAEHQKAAAADIAENADEGDEGDDLPF